MHDKAEQECEPKWMNPDILEKLRYFSKSRQAALRSEGKIPFSRNGRYIRYSMKKIDEWILSHKVA